MGSSRFLTLATLGLFSAWLYSQIWLIAGPVGTNIDNAAEAGVTNTVTQSTWLALWLLAFILIATLTTLFSLAIGSTGKHFSWHEVLLAISVPITTTALFPLIGFYGPIIAFWICGISVVILRRRRRYVL